MAFSSGYRLRGRALLVLVVLLCLATATGACSFVPSFDTDGEVTSLTVVPEDTARLVRGAETTVLRSARAVSAGDRIEMADGQVSRLNAGPEMILELSGATVEIASASHFRLISGSVLVRTSSPVQIDAGRLRASAVKGVFRVDRRLANRVANYRGNSVEVSSPEEALRVPAYRQVVTIQGVLPRAVQPLRFSSSDPWDRRLLSRAIDLDGRVSNFAQGLEAQLGDSQGLDFFARVAPGNLSLDFLRPHLSSRRSDLLIGLILSSEASRLQNVPLDLRFDRIFRLWAQGASWGLLAQEFGVETDSLFSRLTEAVGRARIQVIGAGPALLQPGTTARSVSPRRAGARTAAPPAAPPGGEQAAPPTPRPAILPPGVKDAVPRQLTEIINDVYGVTDPVADLPPLL